MVDYSGVPWITTDCNGLHGELHQSCDCAVMLQWIVVDYSGVPWMTADCSGLQWKLHQSCDCAVMLQWVVVDYSGVPWITADCSGLQSLRVGSRIASWVLRTSVPSEGDKLIDRVDSGITEHTPGPLPHEDLEEPLIDAMGAISVGRGASRDEGVRAWSSLS